MHINGFLWRILNLTLELSVARRLKVLWLLGGSNIDKFGNEEIDNYIEVPVIATISRIVALKFIWPRPTDTCIYEKQRKGILIRCC